MLKTDRTLGSDWLVDDGLAPGDRLIVDGLQKVRPGDKAQPVVLDPPPTIDH
jgi:membrane fusion protein, multidrug efflux system